MTYQEMYDFIRVQPRSYGAIICATHDGAIYEGFFLTKEEPMNDQNKWRFITGHKYLEYLKNPSQDLTIILNGDDIATIVR